MSAASDYLENLALAWTFTADTVTRPTAWYMALHLSDPGEDGSAGEVTTTEDAAYVRKAITFATPSGGQSLSSSQVSWTVDGASAGYTVTHASIFDAATAGNCLMKGALTASRTLAANDVLTFNAGEVVASLD